MPDKAKIIPIIAILVALVFAGAGFFLLQKEKSRSSNLQVELDTVQVRAKAAEAKLEEFKRTISQLEAKLKDAQGNIDTLSADLEQEAKAKQEVQGQAQQLKSDLEQQKTLRSDLEAKLSQAQNDAQKAQDQLKELQSKKDKLDTKLKELETQLQQAQTQSQGVELGTIVVSPETSNAPVPAAVSTPAAEQPKSKAAQNSSLEGKVLVINKDYNFVVINLGSKDGINSGDKFSLYHNNKYIGDVKAEKIHDSMTAADFETASMKDAVSEGDRVVQKTK
jgi:ABC-type transporter Mla subunit MlaD